MPDEFRIGDLAPELTGTSRGKPAAAGIDPTVFPELAGFLRGSPGDFRGRLDRLAAVARQEGGPEAQAGLQAALRLLPDLYSKFGG